MPKEFSKEPDRQTYIRWRELVNMTPAELKSFLRSDMVRMDHLRRTKADRQRIKDGRESARWLIRMIPRGSNFKAAQSNWTPTMWSWARRQVSFISRIRRNTGLLRDAEGKPTKKLLSLLLWGHNPDKPLRRVRKTVEIVQIIRDIGSGLLDELFLINNGVPYLVKDITYDNEIRARFENSYVIVQQGPEGKFVSDRFKSSTFEYAEKKISGVEGTGILGKPVNSIDGVIVYSIVAVQTGDTIYKTQSLDVSDVEETLDPEPMHVENVDVYKTLLVVRDPEFNIRLLSEGNKTGVLSKDDLSDRLNKEYILGAEQNEKFIVYGAVVLDSEVQTKSVETLPEAIKEGVSEAELTEFSKEGLEHFYHYSLKLLQKFDTPYVIDVPGIAVTTVDKD